MYLYMKFNKNVQYEKKKQENVKVLFKNPVIKTCKNIFFTYFDYVYIFFLFFFS